MQRGDGHPPRFLGSAGAAGRAETDAVERQPNDRLVDAVFGADRRDMGLMVADGNSRNIEFFGQAQGEMGGGKIGMQVVSDDLRSDVEYGQQVADRFL